MSNPILQLDPTDLPFHPSLEDSAALAGFWHAGQTDKSGAPYIGHLMRVSANLRRLFPQASMAERHAAWLHDVLEDTAITAADLRGRGYAPEVIRIVEAVTKRPDDPRSYAERIETLATSGNAGAIRVKIADLTDNAAPARLEVLDASQAASLGKRYSAALKRLQQALAGQSVVLDEDDPEAPDMVPLMLAVEPVDYWVLGEAALMADRILEAFVLEEATSLAHRIVATGSVRHVDLARDHQAAAAEMMDGFRRSEGKHEPIAEWAAAQAISHVATDADRDRSSAPSSQSPSDRPGRRPKS